MAYKRHTISKGARQAHHKREKKRRVKARKEGGAVHVFGYSDTRGLNQSVLHGLSISKGNFGGSKPGGLRYVKPKSDEAEK